MIRKYIFIALGIFILLCFIALLLSHHANIKIYKDNISKLEIENQHLSDELIRMNKTISDYELQKLIQKGLKDPINDLKNDLLKHPELIPYQGELGGTVGFERDINSIKILNEKWVLAIFSDGHFVGEIILEYKISNKTIIWKVIDSYKK